MRNALLGSLLLALSTTVAVGCADETGQQRLRRGIPTEVAANESSAEPPVAKHVAVTGHISAEGNGLTENGMAGKNVLTVARSIEVLSLQNNGDLTPVTTTEVQPGSGGAFNLTLNDPQNANKDATGLFILKVKDAFGAVVGSGVVNGLPAFLNAFFIDATIDTVTSFKTEILVTLAKKGVPGIQNYLNVINAYVDAQLANSIAVVGVLSTDITTIIGTTSDAILAATKVLEEALNKAGLPLDLSAYRNAQAAVIGGIQDVITDSTGKLVSASQGLIAAIQAGLATAIAPIDQAIFNAIVNGGMKFGGDMKKTVAGFSAEKGIFKLDANLVTAKIQELFKNASTDVLTAVTQACTGFLDQVDAAKTTAELNAAKDKLHALLLGKNEGENNAVLRLLTNLVQQILAVVQRVEATLNPLANELKNAATTLDPNVISTALTQLDQNQTKLSKSLEELVKVEEANALAMSLIALQKITP